MIVKQLEILTNKRQLGNEHTTPLQELFHLNLFILLYSNRGRTKFIAAQLRYRPVLLL